MHNEPDPPQRLDITLKVTFGPLTIRVEDARLKAKLDQIAESLSNLKEIVMATQAELAQQLRDLTAQNEKSRVEILQKIADLEAALANGGGTTPEVDEALAALKASVQTDDDIVPDAPPVP